MTNPSVNCPCDQWVHPLPLKISAGLDTLPRQIATFPEFRRAMLAALKDSSSLAKWQGGGDDDLGTMLLEMWAYVCDNLAFYDQVIAHEAYLRTAQQHPSLRKLTGLLGYVSRPAVAASVKLAVLAEGRQALTLPAGTAFRSGSFDGEPPQVFELDRATQVHPFLNQFTLKRPRPKTLVNTVKGLLLKYGTANLKRGDLVLIRVRDTTISNQVRVVSSITVVEGKDQERYHQVEFETLTLPNTVSPSQIQLFVPTQKTTLKDLSKVEPVGDQKQEGLTPTQQLVVLDGYYPQIKPKDFVVLIQDQDLHVGEVKNNKGVSVKITDAKVVDVLTSSNTTVKAAVPPVSSLATRLTISYTDSTWKANEGYQSVVVHYNFVDGGIVTVEASGELKASDAPFTIADSLEQPTEANYPAPANFVLEDKNEVGLEVGGSLSFADAKLELNPNTSWSPSLLAPVSVYGNLIRATRGETIKGEILGGGDAAQANQSFILRKKPLTYLAAPTTDNDRGVASTLQIYVNDIRWQEVPSFYNVQSNAQVYIVRQNDKGESIVTFGDGKRGARLPTGTNNIVANYRYGAGAATPPAGSITQLAKPVKGLSKVRNPVAAFGGDDAESTQDLRKYAPNSALILGRAVSIWDMEALAASVPGVRAVKVEWRWHDSQQRPVVQVYYIGQAGIEHTIAQKLRALSDTTTPIAVTVAKAQKVRLSIDLEIDDRYLLASKVFEVVETKLLSKGTGLLTPEQVGIGRPFYRSRLFAAVATVPGILSVSGILWNSQPFAAFALSPGSGQYFDFETQDKNWLSKKEFSTQKGGLNGV